MPQLYTVRFTTRKLVKKYNSKGKIESETRLDTAISYTALPYSTAMSYSGADNFKIEKYEMEEQHRPRGTGRDASVGNGTKSSWRGSSAGEVRKPLAKAAPVVSGIMKAAATGDLAAAINGGK